MVLYQFPFIIVHYVLYLCTMNKIIPDIKENIDELENMLHKTKNAEMKTRINMLTLLKKQLFKTRIAVAKHFGFHRNAIGRWLSSYQHGGINAMLEIKSTGAPKGQRSLPQEVIISLREKLKDNKGFGSYIQIQSWIKNEYGIETSYSTLYKLIRRELQAKPKVPRKSHKEKNQEETDAFHDNFGERLISKVTERESTGEPTREPIGEPTRESTDVRPIRAFVMDETRLGLMPIIRRRITLKGVKPIQQVHLMFENYYIYGAVEPTTGDSFFLELPHLNSDWFQIFLDEFSMNYKDDFLVMLLDNGLFHKAKKLVIPSNVLFLFLPPYSPELSPIERLWQDVKYKLSFWLYETLAEHKNAVGNILNGYSFDDIASLTGYSYIVDAVNAL